MCVFPVCVCFHIHSSVLSTISCHLPLGSGWFHFLHEWLLSRCEQVVNCCLEYLTEIKSSFFSASCSIIHQYENELSCALVFQ